MELIRDHSLSAVHRSALALIAIGIMVIVVYWPGLTGPFIFDDTIHIVSNTAIALERLDFAGLRTAALSNETDPLGRPLALITFALNHYLAGGTTSAFPFKVTNLFIHLINTGLVYWLTLLLFRQLATRPGFHPTKLHSWLPALVAGIWALHPIGLTSVLYVVQRMTSLSVLFILAGLITFIYGRVRVQEGRGLGYTLMTLGLLGGVVLGLTSKETSVLLPFFMLVIEYVFFRTQNQGNHTFRKLRWYYTITIFIPSLAVLIWLLLHPDYVLRTYAWREFSLFERLLTEPRVLWFYVSLLVLPIPSRFSLFHDDIPISTSLLDPWTTSVALVGVLLAISVGALVARRYPVLSFSILWFAVGHVAESTFIALEIAHEHRNYLADFGPILGVVYVLARVFEHFRASAIPIAAFILILTTLVFSTYTRARIWMSDDSIATHLVTHHPRSARAHSMAAELHVSKRNPVQVINHYKRASELAPHETGYLLRLVVTAARTRVNQLKTEANSERALKSAKLKLPKFISIKQSGDTSRLEPSRSIIEEITQKLRNNPVNGRTAQGLEELAACVATDRDNCGYLYANLVEWYQLGIRNPRIFRGIRNDMVISLVTTQLAYEGYTAALDTARWARAIDPANPNFILMEADVHFRLDELDKSEQTLLSLNSLSVPLKPSVKEQAEILSALIKSRRNQTPSQ